MTWTFAEIEKQWIPGNVAVTPEEMVSTFNRVERVLGREWLEASQVSDGMTRTGFGPTLRIVSMGQKLAAIEDILPEAAKLIEHTRRNDQAAETELAAIYLLRSRRPLTEINLYPPVGNRVADFRIRQGNEPWVYSEATKADISVIENRVRNSMQRLASLVETIKMEFALEVFLRREPSEDEVEIVSGLIPTICTINSIVRQELPNGLGFFALNECPPGQIVPREHPGEEERPRLGIAKAAVGGPEPNRHIAVRVAFSDERAEEFLRKESRQLPEDSPGLVMVDMSTVPGGFAPWEPLIRRRFQPTIHRRVSAVSLFRGGTILRDNGADWVIDAKTITNPYARNPLPQWIIDTLNAAACQFAK